MAAAPLSVVILAKNEAGRIRACIESARWANEVLVIDDESTDGTAAVAESLGARVLRRRMDIEGRHRNWAHAQAAYEWVFSLDADERFTPELAREVEATVRGEHTFDIYAVPRRNYLGLRWIRHGGWYPSAQVKLFKRSVFRWEETTVHPRAIAEGPTGTLRHDLLHYSYRDLTDFVQKLDRQTTLEAEKWLADRRRIPLGKALWRAADRFWRAYVSKQGYRDGLWGYVLAVMAGMYQLLSYAKYWEQRRGTAPEAVVAPFTELIRGDEHFDRPLLMSHLCAYRLAAQAGKGKRLLEIGSGTGYGAWYLAHVAGSVLAVDADSKLIERAKRLFCRANLTYEAMDGTRLGVPDASMDTVGTFQVIEHIPEPLLEQFVREIARVLRPDGLAVISTLNLDHNRKPGGRYEQSPFHEKEFTSAELDALLRRVFPSVAVYGLYPRRRYALLRRLKKWGLNRLPVWPGTALQRFFRDGLQTDDHVLRPGATRAAIDLIAFCAKQPRPMPTALEPA